MKRYLLILLFTIVANSVFANINQSNWRWRNTDGSEKTATWKAAQNTAITVNNQNPFRLRVEIYNETSDSTKTITRGLEYATSSAGPWTAINNASPLNAFIFAGDSYYITHNEPTTKQLTGVKYPTFGLGNVITNANTADVPIRFNKSYEYEFNIKATAYAQPNTTYYFRASNTDGAGGAGYPRLTTGTSFTAKTAILTNGGFETTQPVWSPSVAAESAATIAPNTVAAQVHSGTKALKVTVTNKGATNSVKVMHSGFTADAQRTYLLRFWALAEQNNALLNINLKSSAGDNTCSYKISKRFDAAGNGWQLYEYPFKTTSGNVSLEISFNTNTTYYLDDVEIFDDTQSSGVDVATQYKWWHNQPNPGWISGDNDTSVELPDGRTAWVFSDSFMGTTDPHTNFMSSNRIINNLVVVEDEGQFSYAIQGTPGNSQSLFSPIGGRVLWNSGAVVEGNELKVVLVQVNGLDTEGTYIGTLSLPDLQVVGTPKQAYHDISAIMQDGEYNYMYYGETVGSFERYTKVGRVKIGSLDSKTPWEFYTNAGTWSTSETDAKRLVSGSVATHVTKLGPGSYVMNAVPNLSSEIAVWFAPSPEGPWINRTIVYQIPQREGVLAYFGHMDAGTGQDGNYTFTYSTYPFIDDPVAMQRNDKGVYTIKYAKANLLELSPFTPKQQPDSLTSYSVNSVGKNVILKFTTALNNHDHFEIQQSTDLVNWAIIDTIAGGTGTSFTTQFPNPKPGVVYYRMKLFDADKNLTVLKPVKYTSVPKTALASASVVKNGSEALISFSTGFEILNPGFRLGKSKTLTPNVGAWTEFAQIEGAGTKGGITSYSLADVDPGSGTTYYGLAYFKNGVETYAYLGSYEATETLAKTQTTMQFDVYPNPASSSIQFALKDYKGSTVTATVTNVFGKVMGKETFKVTPEGTYKLRTKPAAGIYILNVNGSGLSKSARVIVE